MLVRPLTDDDQGWKENTLRRAWGSTEVARQGQLIDAAALPGFVAVLDAQRVGLLTYARSDDHIEIVTIHVEHEGLGTGRALMEAALAHAHDVGTRRLWLSTTNDNVRAFRFYQQWGMDLLAVIHDGVAVSRQVKPSIPVFGAHGIPIRHELVFELQLRAGKPVDART